MNEAGDVVGEVVQYYSAGIGSGGITTDLSQFTYPYAINKDKYVAGTNWGTNLGQDHWIPLVWHDGETLHLPCQYNTMRSEAFSINQDGLMVGYTYTLAADYIPMLWQNGQYYNLNDLLAADALAAGWTIGLAWTINDHGVIVASGNRPGWSGLVLLLPTPAVQLITPSGDPINAPVDTAVDGQNEFTFDASNPGVLNVHLKAKVLATGTAGALASRCRFTIENIGSTSPVWASANPGGQPTNTSGDYLEADLTFTGLPTNNSDFGRKKVTITVDGTVKDQKAMEVFYSAKEYNHPGGNPTEPNWFYYYKQNAGGGSYSYDATPGARSSSVAGGGEVSIKIGDYVHSPGGEFITTSMVAGRLSATGISPTNKYYPHFIGVLGHERQHANNEVTSGPPADRDLDYLPNTFETTTSNTDPDDKYSASGTLVGTDDGEVYAGGPVEENGVKNANSTQDWASPGSNSR